MKLIVGLGNPGLLYKSTRHNIGFMVLDAYAKEHNLKFKNKKEFKGDVCIEKEFILLKPLTYMNNSGEAVLSVKNFYKIDVKDILVISDDFNIPFLKLRLREKGSSGGHNGLKSIIEKISSNEFNRLRFGLGSPEHNNIDFVLSKFSKDELEQIEKTYPKTNETINEFIKGTAFDLIMNKFNVSESI